MADQAGAPEHAPEGVGIASKDQPGLAVQQSCPNEDYTCDTGNLAVRSVERMRFWRPLLPRPRRVALPDRDQGPFGFPADVYSQLLQTQDSGRDTLGSGVSSSGPPSTSGASPTKQAQEERRQICFDFTKGVCSRGVACKYSHSVEHIIAVNSEEKGICFDFLKGLCNRGLMCRFSHDLTNLQPPQEVSTGKRKYAPICYDFVKNQCSRGDDCRYSHDYASIFYGPRNGGKNLNIICVDYTRGRCMRGDSCRYFHPPGIPVEPSMFAQSMAHIVTMQQNPAVWSAAANNLTAMLPYGQPIPAHSYAAVGWDGSSYAIPPTMPQHYYPVHHVYQQHMAGPSGGESAPIDQQQLLRQLQELAIGNERQSAVFQSDCASGQHSQHAVSEQPSASLLAALGHGIGPQSGLGVPPAVASGSSDLARGLEMGLGAHGHVQPQGAESFQASAALRAVAAAAAAAAVARVSEQGNRPPSLADQLPELSDLTGGVGVATAAASLPGSDAILGCKRSSDANNLGSRMTGSLSQGPLFARSLTDAAKEAAQHPKRDVMLASALAALSRNGSADLSPTIPAGWHTDQGVEDINVSSLTQAGSVFGMLPHSTAVQPSRSLAHSSTSLLGSAAAPVRQPSLLGPLHTHLTQEGGSSIASGVHTPLSADGAMTTRAGDTVDERVGLELLQSIWALHGVQ